MLSSVFDERLPGVPALLVVGAKEDEREELLGAREEERDEELFAPSMFDVPDRDSGGSSRIEGGEIERLSAVL